MSLRKYVTPSSNSKLFLQPDLLGSARLVTNSARQNVCGSGYEPFGTNYGPQVDIYVDDNPERYVDSTGNMFDVPGLALSAVRMDKLRRSRSNNCRRSTPTLRAYERAHPPQPSAQYIDPSPSITATTTATQTINQLGVKEGEGTSVPPRRLAC
jgi:hypothetical protein